ncbi:MAG: LEA type 2 family protein [Phycisphaeraceae bacterium]|nr:LEA type 2 family protein [Phycisphaeraceae bacterium]
MSTRPPIVFRVFFASLAVFAAAMLPACASTSAPRFEFAGASVTEHTAEGVAVSITVDAYNDNDIALPLRDIDYVVEIDGRTVFRGTRSAEATLRRRGVQQIRLPAVVVLAPGERGPTGEADIRLVGRVTYITPGKLAEILFDSGVRVPSAPVAVAGRVDLGAP